MSRGEKYFSNKITVLQEIILFFTLKIGSIYRFLMEFFQHLQPFQLAEVIQILFSEILGFWTLSVIWYSKKLENTTFRKLDLFLSSGDGADTQSVGSRTKANLSHWIE
jgi:hypothetical protein